MLLLRSKDSQGTPCVIERDTSFATIKYVKTIKNEEKKIWLSLSKEGYIWCKYAGHTCFAFSDMIKGLLMWDIIALYFPVLQ